jgi:hypothetical protein
MFSVKMFFVAARAKKEENFSLFSANWRINAPCATTIGAPIHPAPIVLAHHNINTLQVHRVNRVLGFLSSRPNWDPPNPLNRR